MDETDDTQDPSNSGALSAIATQLQDAFDPSTTPEAQEYSRRILNRTMSDPYAEEQSQLFTDLEKSTKEAQDVLRAAREKLMARRYNPSDAWFALAGALGSPTQTGSRGEVFSNAAKALRPSIQARFDFDTDKAKEALGYDEQIQALQQRLLQAKLGAIGATRKSDVELAKEALKTLGRRTAAANSTPDKGAQAVDRVYAKDYVDWLQNGEPEASQALKELNASLDTLHGVTRDDQGNPVPMKNKPPLTGPVVGSLSTLPFGVGKWVQDLLFPTSANTQEQIESTVQRSLRPILGAQFTEKEGERLISRVYNPRLSEEVNAKRIEWLIGKLNTAYANKQEAAAYFRQHNTLSGFSPKHQFSIDDFMPDSTTPGEPGYQGKVQDDDYAPPKTLHLEDLPPGTPVLKLKDLPHRKFAEGGPVTVPKGKVAVQLDDGTVVFVAPGSTQEDVNELIAPDTPEPPAAVKPTPQRSAPAAAAAPDTGGSDDGSLERMLFGAGAGTATGLGAGLSTMAAGARLRDMLPGSPGKQTPAEARLMQLMEKYNLPPSQIVADVKRAQKRGVPAMAMDVGPEAFRSVAETALPQGGTQTQDLLDRLTQRQLGSRDRTMEQVNRGLKPDDYFAKEQELKDRLYGTPQNPSESSKLYQQAEQAFPSVNSKQLFQIMGTPSGKIAVKKAVKAIRDKPGATLGKTDAMGMITKPSLQFLNEVKLQLDDAIRKEEGSGVNYQPTAQGKKLRDLRDSFVSELDRATTDPKTGVSPYAVARQQYQTDAGMLSALQSGREDFSKLQPQELTAKVKGMSFEQKDAFRSGVAQSLYEMLEKPSTDINAARRLIGSPGMKKKLETLFDNPNEFRVFSEALNQEMSMFENSKNMLEQKATIARRGVAPQPNLLQRGAAKAPSLGIFSPTYWALKLIRSKPEMSGKEASQLIELLKSATPDELAKFAALQPKFGRAAARRSARGKAGMVGAAIGAIAGTALGGADDSQAEEPPPEEEPLVAKKRGGKVRFADGGKVGMVKSLAEELPKQTLPNILTEQLAQLRAAARDMSNSAARAPIKVPSYTDPSVQALASRKQALFDALDRQALEQNPADLENISKAASTFDTAAVSSQPNPQLLDQLYRQLVDMTQKYRVNPSQGVPEDRLRQLMQRLAPTEKRRGGRIARQCGGMTTHA